MKQSPHDAVFNEKMLCLSFIWGRCSAGQELQGRQHAHSEPTHPPDGRRRRLHRLRPPHSVHGQVS